MQRNTLTFEDVSQYKGGSYEDIFTKMLLDIDIDHLYKFCNEINKSGRCNTLNFWKKYYDRYGITMYYYNQNDSLSKNIHYFKLAKMVDDGIYSIDIISFDFDLEGHYQDLNQLLAFFQNDIKYTTFLGLMLEDWSFNDVSDKTLNVILYNDGMNWELEMIYDQYDDVEKNKTFTLTNDEAFYFLKKFYKNHL